MKQFVERIYELGFKILPYSFALYFQLRCLESIWKQSHTRLVKGIWYLALGITYLIDKVGIET